MTRYGTDVILAIAIIVIVLLGLAFWTPELWLRIILIAVALFLGLFSLNFFRDPDRSFDAKGRSVDNLIISPADGTVVEVVATDEPDFLKGPATRISIFMSPLNVHVNRSPISGTVEYFRYVKGEFLVAHAPEATHKNERAIIGIANGTRKVLFAQVAGYIARRIVCSVKVGDHLSAGERFGMIKFGSRVDIYIPPEGHLLVTPGEIVRAGETILAEFT